MLRAKCEVHALGVEAAYWFTPQFNVSVRYSKEYEGRARLGCLELYLDACSRVLAGKILVTPTESHL